MADTWIDAGRRHCGVESKRGCLDVGEGKNPAYERATTATMSDPLHGGLQTGPASRFSSDPGTVININCLL